MLKKFRANIDTIDKKLLELLNKRANIAKQVADYKKSSNNKIIFANWGNRSESTKILEFETAKQYNINLKFGIGGSHKESSSSDLLKRWSEYSKKI